jgi:hypothetical protein
MQYSSSTRRKGLIRFLCSLAAFAVVLAIFLWVLPRLHLQATPIGLAVFALPGAFAIAGLLEMVTGIPLGDTAQRWDQLKGWQRGVLGTTIVLVAGFLIICAFAYFASQ